MELDRDKINIYYYEKYWMKELEKKIWLNLGSGNLLIPSSDTVHCINIDWADDVRYAGDTVIKHDLRYGLPKFIQPDSVDFINMSQFFEHLNLYDELRLLEDCHRVLRKDGYGKMRISVPDAGLLSVKYDAGQMDEFAGVQPEIYTRFQNQSIKLSLLLFGSLDKHGESGHKMMWTIGGMIEILQKTNFKNIEPVPFNPRFDAPIAENHQLAVECGI